MTVKIGRTKSGEDVICDIKEVRKTPESTEAFMYRLDRPYNLCVIDNSNEMLLTENKITNQPRQLSDVEFRFYPYTVFNAETEVFVRLDHFEFLYNPHSAILEKYHELIGEVEEYEKDPEVLQ